MPVVLSQEIGRVEANYLLNIPRDLIWFKGHFPGVPILPGVVQIDWVVRLIESLKNDLKLVGEFGGVDRLKFMRLIEPDSSLRLSLKASPDGHSVKFLFYDDDGSFSSGKITLRV